MHTFIVIFNSLTPSKSPEWLREKLFHFLQRFPLGFRQYDKEPNDSKEWPPSIKVVSAKVKSLYQDEEGVGHQDVETPVEACGHADTYTSEPQGIYLIMGIVFIWDFK